MRAVAWTVTALVACFLILPIVVIIPMAFSSSSYLEFPPPGFSLQWFESFFSSQQWMRATGVSLTVAFWTVLLATTLGTLAAFGLKRFRGAANLIATGYLTSPLMVPLIAFAIGLYLLFVNVRLNGTIPGLVLAHTVLALPYVIINVAAPLANLPPVNERAARSLGAHPLRAFGDVTLPAILPGVLAGALFAFLTSFDEVILSVFVSGVRTSTLPVLMWESVQTDLDPTIAAIAVLLTALTIVSLALAQLVTRVSTRRNRTS
jgi:putative spermidine/putrescine transport system permease protein